MVSISSKGDFKNFENFARRMIKKEDFYKVLDMFGKQGVAALTSATPKDTGKTSKSWYYKIEVNEKTSTVAWYNSNTVYGPNGPSVAILIQYGHATRNGAFVQAKDYINPAMKDIFNQLAEAMWKEVTK